MIRKIVEHMLPRSIKVAARKRLYRRIPYGLSQRIERWWDRSRFENIRGLATRCERNGCIYVHVPRTGGMSVSRALFGSKGFGGHYEIWTYPMLLPEATFRRLFKFGFVRNPWDRLLSAYRYLSDGGMTEDDARFSTDVLSSYDSFSTFVVEWLAAGEARLRSRPHFRPQHEWLCDPAGEVAVDFVGRFERIEADFETVCRELERDVSLPHYNASNRASRGYRKYYTSEAAEVAGELYARDIEIFDYSF